MSVNGQKSSTPFTHRLLNPVSWRAIGILLLTLLMLIPIAMVGGVVDERQTYYHGVLDEIARSWGSDQALMGPVMVIPFTVKTETEEEVTDEQGRKRTISKTHRALHHAHFLPKDLSIDADLTEQFRARSIYSALVYDADVALTAKFESFDVQSMSENIETTHWDKAWIAVGLSDTRAIDSVTGVRFNDSELALSPGTQLDWLGRGFHAKTKLVPGQNTHLLSMKLKVKGSDRFMFAPFGETTRVSMASSWPHPSFTGNALPDTRTIGDDGFKASWEIPHLARNYPQQWTHLANPNEIHRFKAGVRMFEPVSLYSQLTRSVKYGILFIGLTFITLFGFELAIKQSMHMIQFVLIGAAMCLFYLIVLSLSEHISFVTAYLAGAAVVATMVSAYTWAVLRRLGRALSIFALLAGLYTLLYSVLQMEDYALLMGTGVLVLVVVALMFATRNLHRPDRALEQQL
jgi:inner membrane protein